ncbi:MAG: LemA family protein [Gemmatimonadetes bacterium]|uniref:LemA family protein n=1 Tax=Candidatus Kutchimonas denitrificans TaxID=3056748 RepID=A0AAE4ZB27_9BACT|nr:LemA family protein [Gemmatimonadota bacterium]NIR75892.1 LemA family protein [Candidatus Kutchimonas denitrificans]NIS02053.1 LemA family protein [Gemmatimonadota bacterium]NIT67859.1 LemA family protein [Gemmatimonadota bacterium]NIU53838.1 LemA family protein [Gemmatimonadota bacterium]
MNNLIVLGVIAVVGVIVVIYYNKLASLRVRADAAWADIDVQLKRRYDLIPNLVETVKGYASHERETFERVTEMRAAAINAEGVAEQAQAENMLTQALRSVFAVAENYPELRASENFTQLQNSLVEIEDKIQAARRYYNAVVRDYNTAVHVVPSSLVAWMFNFKDREYFELESEAERTVPKVDFGG